MKGLRRKEVRYLLTIIYYCICGDKLLPWQREVRREDAKCVRRTLK